MSPLAKLTFTFLAAVIVTYIAHFILKAKCKIAWLHKAMFILFLVCSAAASVCLPLYLRQVFEAYHQGIATLGGIALVLCFACAFFAPWARNMKPIAERLAIAGFLLFGAIALGCLCYEGRIMLDNETSSTSAFLALI